MASCLSDECSDECSDERSEAQKLSGLDVHIHCPWQLASLAATRCLVLPYTIN